MTTAKANDIFQSIMLAGHSSKPVATPPAIDPSNETDSVSKLDAAAVSASSTETATFPSPSSLATQEGSAGIRYDFNQGVRVTVPKGIWRVRLTDLDTDTVIFDGEGSDATFQSRKKHYLNARIEVFQAGLLVFSHDYDAQGKKIAILMAGNTIGDTAGWVPYAVRFARDHACELTVMVSEQMKELLSASYPDIRFVEKQEFSALKDEFYATYYIGLFFGDEDNTWQPADFRIVGLHRTAGYILGVSPEEEPLHLDIPDERPIAEPYVVIASQASAQCKYWNNPTGWYDVVEFLKRSGYRVICIDREIKYGQGLHWNQIPHNAEDETGARPLRERLQWLKHAEFFVGLSSGLSWLAWAADTPVVMISGFTHPTNEFQTPYRVFNTNTCNSCWHDIRYPFMHNDFLFCPRHAGTSRQFECTRNITSGQVIRTIKAVMREHPLESAHHPSE
ncbi:MAG: autotransporter strand-loop-strand O-heptosyltransferase [Gluconobacter cerinus]|uniref:autotransporter strand-loop-strand O-heptosyltransferase n=1 Tax=Gluconobacter cerinus TaxID=38307 RepID=UPI0039EAFF60